MNAWQRSQRGVPPPHLSLPDVWRALPASRSLLWRLLRSDRVNKNSVEKTHQNVERKLITRSHMAWSPGSPSTSRMKRRGVSLGRISLKLDVSVSELSVAAVARGLPNKTNVGSVACAASNAWFMARSPTGPSLGSTAATQTWGTRRE